MTGPTQNLGLVAQGQKMAKGLVDGLAMILAKVGASTPFGQDITKCITMLGKHVQADAGPSDALKQMAMKQTQMAPHQAAMGAAQPAPKPPAAPMAA